MSTISTIFVESSILDVWKGSEYASGLVYWSSKANKSESNQRKYWITRHFYFANIGSWKNIIIILHKTYIIPLCFQRWAFWRLEVNMEGQV